MDDGSGEAYSTFFEQVEPYAVVLHNPHNMGKGATLKNAMRALCEHFPNAEYFVTADSDGQHLVKDILRDEWGFDGMVVTDWGVKNDPVKEVRAGNDMKMHVGYPEDLMAGYNAGELTRADLELCVKRILEIPQVYNFYQRLVGVYPYMKVFSQKYIFPVGKDKKIFKILDMGCGTGIIIPYLPKNIEYLGIDCSFKYIEYVQKEIQIKNF